MTVTVAPARPSDLDVLANLFDLYRVSYGRASDRSAARAFLAERMERGESVILLATLDDDDPVGFTQLYPVFSSVSLIRSWLLNDLFVHADARRRGVATALMHGAIEHARVTGYGRVELETAHDNRAAQALYERLGFERVEGFHHYQLAVA